jgi:hypothetical protein
VRVTPIPVPDSGTLTWAELLHLSVIAEGIVTKARVRWLDPATDEITEGRIRAQVASPEQAWLPPNRSDFRDAFLWVTTTYCTDAFLPVRDVMRWVGDCTFVID